MSILDNFDIPFSTYGSYLSFHYYDETYMNAPDIATNNSSTLFTILILAFDLIKCLKIPNLLYKIEK